MTLSTRSFRLLLAVVLAGIPWLVHPQPAAACPCLDQRPDFEAALATAEIIFVGRVVEIEGGKPPLLFDNPIAKTVMPGVWNRIRRRAFFRQVKFEVLTAWRGIDTRSAVVLTGQGGGDCGFIFDIGREYLVYGSDTDGYYFTHICTRTADLGSPRAAADVARLAAEPTVPLAPVLPADLIVVICLAAGAALAAGLAARRRHK